MNTFIYENSRGDTINLSASPLWVTTFNDLRSYGYERIEQNGVVFGHRRRRNVEKTLQFQYFDANRQAFFDFREEFFRIINHDLLAGTLGRLHHGDYYAEGVFSGETVEEYRPLSRLWVSSAPFFMPEEVWRRRVGPFLFEASNASQDTASAALTANYPANYPRGLVTGNSEYTLKNDSAFPSPFQLTVYGSSNNPTVTIGGHVYAVNLTVPANSRLVIDSAAQTITLYDALNRSTNAFAHQSHEPGQYIFEPIPTGESLVELSGVPKAALILYEERSAAKWS